ncbi:MAG: sigma-70 family RNA polymerase sigma factor [Oceanicaulis sp.]|nr:sigma-70 family RNA polymerase sigma factor [Oceanicaulis sp.]
MGQTDGPAGRGHPVEAFARPDMRRGQTSAQSGLTASASLQFTPPREGSRICTSAGKPLGEDHPFNSLLAPHGAALRRFALKLTGNEHRAEDLVQETFLKAWAHRDKFLLGTELQGWLFTILRNTFYSELRKYRREVEDAGGKLAEQLFLNATQEHAFELKELLAAIAELPEIHRRPLILMGVYGFSQLEAADACGCTVGTIKSRVSRARTGLSHAFGREDERLPAGPASRPPRPVRIRRFLHRFRPARPDSCQTQRTWGWQDRAQG